MKRLPVLLLATALFAAAPRYARLGDFQGDVQVQLTAASDWMAAERNLPLIESAWLRTGPGSRAEIELDEGGVCRLGPNSQAGLADYSRLSTGQRVTLLTLDRGLAYFTGAPEGKDALTLAVPGAQITLTQSARVRLEVQESSSQIAVLDGAVRFSSRAAEIELHQGQFTRVEPANPARFFLNREIPGLELDRWNEVRDKALANSPSSGHVIERYGLVDLDGAGEWIQTEDLGAIWKPKVADTWLPFQSGRWRWYDTLGYTWVSDDPWGWLPYHYGRWARREKFGWIWAPSAKAVFKPGDVYWLRSGARIVGWGPLAPGEDWKGPAAGPPQEYLIANTTFANFQQDATAIDPAGFTRPDGTLAASFASALPSPAFLASRLDAVRPLLLTRTRVDPVVEEDAIQPRTGPSIVLVNPPPPPPVVVITPPPAEPPPPPAVEPVPYPVPVYIGTIATETPAVLPGTPHSPPPAKPPAPTTKATSQGRSTRPPAPPITPRQPERKFRPGESDIVSEAMKDVSAKNFNKAVADLNRWSERFPHTDFQTERAYYYVLAYDGMSQPAKVVETARQLFEPDARWQDPRQLILAMYLTSVNAQRLTHPTRDQMATAESAAAMLQSSIRDYFVPANKPHDTTDDEWEKARRSLEAAAKGTLAASKR
jgi:hypothetical protein